MEIYVFKLIILVSLLAGSYCISPECSVLIRAECVGFNIKEIQRPETTEDLKNFCSSLIPYVNCAEKMMEKCVQDENMHENEEDMENFRENVRFFKSSCDEDSQVFQAIANKLNCVMTTMDTMDDICYFTGLNDTQVEKLRNLVEGYFGCFVDSWRYFCMNAKYDVQCGNDVRDAVAEILVNIDFVSPYCKYMRSELQYLEAAFKSEFRQDKNGQAVLPGIFEAIIEKTD